MNKKTIGNQKTIKDIYLESIEALADAGLENPSLEARVMVCEAFMLGGAEFFSKPSDIPHDEMILKLESMLERRAQGEPLAYILGRKEFFSRDFMLTPSVLIPRADTELLVEETLGILKGFPPSASVLEIGTGSGCVAITVALESRIKKILATDISQDALLVAEENARRLGVLDKIEFLLGDMFEPLEGSKFDIVVSNPPYVSESEFGELENGVKKYEPHCALFGGESGLSYLRSIIYSAVDVLKPGGYCVVEMGFSQRAEVVEIFGSRGYSEVGVAHDLAGRPRVVKGKWKES